MHLDLDPLVPDDTSADSPAAVAAALRADGWHVVDADSVSDVALVLGTAGVLGG